MISEDLVKQRYGKHFLPCNGSALALKIASIWIGMNKLPVTVKVSLSILIFQFFF
jgi:hypothetical protein